MNLRKHVAGFALFSIIVGSAIFIHAYLTASVARFTPVPVSAPVLPSAKRPQPEPVTNSVRLVSLDFINRQTFTTLSLKREAGQPAPQRIFVTTFFFAPGGAPGREWASTDLFLQPFAQGDQVELTATGPCDWCQLPGSPKEGYFAVVYVFNGDYGDDDEQPADLEEQKAHAVPVVVQAEQKKGR